MKKVSYKTYFNIRLKPVNYHGQQTHPLYVQVTYERKTIFFKSYYFELFSKPRFALTLPDGSIKGPDIELAVKREKEVIEFVIGKIGPFSFEKFQKFYTYFRTDLCEVTAWDFVTFLYIFFDERELPAMAEAVKWATLHVLTYDLIKELERTMDKKLYREMMKRAFGKAPPYMQLYSFVLHTRTWPERYLTAMEWYDNDATVAAFKAYAEKYFPDSPSTTLIAQLNNWANYRR